MNPPLDADGGCVNLLYTPMQPLQKTCILLHNASKSVRIAVTFDQETSNIPYRILHKHTHKDLQVIW